VRTSLGGTTSSLPRRRYWNNAGRAGRIRGEDRQIDQVTSADADAYKTEMIRTGLAKATIAKRLRYARHYFKVAIRRELVKANPFGHLSVQVKGDPPGGCTSHRRSPAGNGRRPGPRMEIAHCLGAVGRLADSVRSAGLTWRDVDFAGKRFIVRASKTEHHADGGIRVVPMFPELARCFRPSLTRGRGAVYVVSRYRDPKQNLRTQLRRYAEQAG